LAEHDVQTVFILVGRLMAKPRSNDLFEARLSNQRNIAVLEAACQSQSRPQVIACYGDEHRQAPCSETCLDQRAYQARGCHFARCGDLFGGGDLDWSNLVPAVIRSALRGQLQPIHLTVSPLANHVYSKDSAAGIVHLAEYLANNPELREVFDVRGDKTTTAIEIVNCITELWGIDLKVTIRHGPDHQNAPASRLRLIPDWQPSIAIQEALQETIAWYERYFFTRPFPRRPRQVPQAPIAA
jgi:nucleoside-diphosphate-sugar epimerase